MELNDNNGVLVFLKHDVQYVLVVSPAQLGKVRQLLDPDDGVIEGRLQGLGHGVGQDHRYHHRQDMGDLASQLEHDDRCGYRVGDCSWQGCRTFGWKGRVTVLK